MSPEELDEARAKEAQRLWESGQEAGSSSWVVAARLARENWTPPEPVDPDLLAFREWGAMTYPSEAKNISAGRWDKLSEAYAFLAGARMAAERERERAKVLVEYVEIHTRRLDGVGGRAVAALAKYRGEAYSDD